MLQVQHSTQSGPFSLHREKSSLSHLTAWQPSWPVDNETEILRGAASRKRQKEEEGGLLWLATRSTEFLLHSHKNYFTQLNTSVFLKQ